MGKGRGWFGLRRDSSGSKGQFSDDLRDECDGEDLCGVGIVFYKAPDNSLFVKALVEGSSACNCGILPGDCLMEVNGKNVYCKGIEHATKIILGKEGTVVTLKLIRIDRGKRIPVSASLVRELRATANPEFNVKRKDMSGVSTSQVFLECLQKDRDENGQSAILEAVSPRARAAHSPPAAGRRPADEVAGTRVEDEEDAGAGVFGASVSGSSSSSSSRPASTVEGDQGPQTRGAQEKGGERKVKYKGRWYTESEIAALEHKARLLKEEVDMVENISHASPAASGARGSKYDDGGAVTSPRAKKDQRLVVGPTLVDLAKGPKPMTKKEEDLNADPEALRAAIKVVEGSKVEKVSNRKLVGRTSKYVFLKVSTGGVLTWGKNKQGHIMWVKAYKQQYAPNMNKDQYTTLNRRFFVMLEGEQVMAHSSQGGTIRASEAAEALEFVAGTVEERDIWVTGINMVLGMAKKEALERETKKRLKEVHAAATLVPSIFITCSPKVAETPRSGALEPGAAVVRTWSTGRSNSAHPEAGAADCGVFGSPNERESVRRADDRARRGWGGKIQVPAGLNSSKDAGAICDGEDAGGEGLRQVEHVIGQKSGGSSHEGDMRSDSTQKGERSPQPSNLSSSSTCPSNQTTARQSLSIDTTEASTGTNYASCATCWPAAVSPKSARKAKEYEFAGAKSVPDAKVKMSPSYNNSASTAVGQSPLPTTKSVPEFSIDVQHPSGGLQAPSKNEMKDEQKTTNSGRNQSLPSLSATGVLQQPSSGDSEGEQILSQLTTAEDTPRPLVPACTPNNGEMNDTECTGNEVVSKAEHGHPVVGKSNNQVMPAASMPAAAVKYALPKFAAPARRPSVGNSCETPGAAAQESQNTAQESHVTPSAPGPTPAPVTIPQSLPKEAAPNAAPVQSPQRTPKPAGDLETSSESRAKDNKEKEVNTTPPVGKIAQRPIPGKAAEGMKKEMKQGMKTDFAAMMAARQKKMREAEEADEGMYFH